MPYDVQAWLSDPFRSHAYADEAQPTQSAQSTNTEGDQNLQSRTESSDYELRSHSDQHACPSSLVPPPLACHRISEPETMGIDLVGTGAFARSSPQGPKIATDPVDRLNKLIAVLDDMLLQTIRILHRARTELSNEREALRSGGNNVDMSL